MLGWDVAGTVDACGDGVTNLEEGAAVWGHLAYSPSTKQGAFAEYVTLPREALAAKPDDVPFHVAASVADERCDRSIRREAGAHQTTHHRPVESRMLLHQVRHHLAHRLHVGCTERLHRRIDEDRDLLL